MDESIVRHLERPQVGTLKLSEAIRIGTRIRPQARGRFFLNGRSCALGAAYEAVYGYPERPDEPRIIRDNLLHAFPRLREVLPEISERNDSGESREAIADWLESQGY